MKRLSGLFVLIFGVSLLGSLPAFAEENQGMEMDMPQGGGEGQGGQQGMMGGGMGGGPGKSPHGMGMMQKDSMIATSDGGIVLKQGPRLIKYDKDLTLVKEVEIPRGKPPVAQKQDQAGTESDQASDAAPSAQAAGTAAGY